MATYGGGSSHIAAHHVRSGEDPTLRCLFLEYVLDPDDEPVEAAEAFSKLGSVILRYGQVTYPSDKAKSILNRMAWTLPATHWKLIFDSTALLT